MKCELCHQADATTAIVRGEGDEGEELYVCRACANCLIGKDHRCGNLVGRLDPSEEGHAIVAWNGSCDRAEWRKSDGEFKLEAEG